MLDHEDISPDDHEPVPSDDAWARETVPAEQPGSGCVLIGPENAGKTTFLLALHEACLQQTDDEFNLEFLPENDSTLALLRSASDFLFRGQAVRATSDVTTYAFRVFVEHRADGQLPHSCPMAVTDGPGGVLLPTRHGVSIRSLPRFAPLLERLQNASNLVLCIDASNPSLEALYNGLPELIFAIRDRHHKLAYRRVLLLLTKIDVVLHRFMVASRAYAYDCDRRRVPVSSVLDLFAGALAHQRLRGAPAVSIDAIARAMSPLGQAQAQVGKIVNLVQSWLGRDTDFAVGACSALGLEGAHLSPAALAASASGALPRRPSVAERLGAWKPFGVREALLFLAAGDVRHPIERVPPRRAGAQDWSRRLSLELE